MIFNSCAHLVNPEDLAEAEDLYNKLLQTQNNPFEYMMGLQLQLQKDLHEKLPERNPVPTELETCGEILDWIRANDDAIDDERRELYTALGGMSNGNQASSVWKNWRGNNIEYRNRKFSDLSEEDRLEVLFENSDQIHFILNQILALGLTAKDVFILYTLKNMENIRRYNTGY